MTLCNVEVIVTSAWKPLKRSRPSVSLGTKFFIDFRFLSSSQEICWEEHLRNDLFCVEWDVNLNSVSHKRSREHLYGCRHSSNFPSPITLPPGSLHFPWQIWTHLMPCSCPLWSGPDYGIGILGKFLWPTASKGVQKMAAEHFEHTFANQSVMFYAL